MSQRPAPIPAELQQLRLRIRIHRMSHGERSRLPPALWQAATQAAERHGAARVADVCGLSLAALSRRSEPPTVVTECAAFVELPAAQVFGTAHPAVPAMGAVVELRDESGGHVTLRLAAGGEAAVDVAAVVAAFWRRRG